MQLLDPFEVDDRNNADLEIGMLGNVDLVGHDRAMQAFIEQQIGAFRQRPPFGKGAWFRAEQLGLVVVVDVVPGGARTGFAVVAKRPLQLLEKIGFGAEMAEVPVAALPLLRHFRAHLGAIVAMEGVALDVGRGYLLAAEDVLERPFDRGRAGARGARDRYDGMTARHLSVPALAKQAAPREQRRVTVVEHRLDAFVNGRHVANAAQRTHDQRHPLVRRLRPEFQNAAPSGGGSAARPLHQQRHGMGFVEQPKPALTIAGRASAG